MLGAQRNIATRCQPALAPLTGGCARPVRQCVRPATLTPRPSALSLAAPVPKVQNPASKHCGRSANCTRCGQSLGCSGIKTHSTGSPVAPVSSAAQPPAVYAARCSPCAASTCCLRLPHLTQAPAGLGLPLQTALAGLRTPLLSKPAEAARPDVRAEASTSGVPAAEPKKFMGIEAMTWIKITALGFMFFCILCATLSFAAAQQCQADRADVGWCACRFNYTVSACLSLAMLALCPMLGV